MLENAKKSAPRSAKRGKDAKDGDVAAPAVLTLVKALDVLEAAATTKNMTVAEIAAKVGLNRSTTHRLVQTLKQLHYLQPTAGGRGFEIEIIGRRRPARLAPEPLHDPTGLRMRS